MPAKYMPISSGASMEDMVAQINRNFSKIDSEVTLKQFKDKNGNVMLEGNIQDGKFGISFLDKNGSGTFIGLYQANRFGIVQYNNGVPVALDGQAPDDGRQGKWVAKPGQNVITLLGG